MTEFQNCKIVRGTYGRSWKTFCNIFEYRGWYVVEGSTNINFTLDDIEDGVDVEKLNDIDTLTSSHPINSIEELIDAIDS